jgi:ribosomal protein S27AE
MSHKPGFRWTVRSRGGFTKARKCARCGVPFLDTRKKAEHCGRCRGASERARKDLP